MDLNQATEKHLAEIGMLSAYSYLPFPETGKPTKSLHERCVSGISENAPKEDTNWLKYTLARREIYELEKKFDPRETSSYNKFLFVVTVSNSEASEPLRHFVGCPRIDRVFRKDSNSKC